MKKHLIIVGIICAASIPPAYAVTKCVKLTSSTTCTSLSASPGQANWSVTCGGIETQGVAFCGSQDGGSTGTKSENVTSSRDNNTNKYCWCKMVSPAVSSWVFYDTTGASADECPYLCPIYCANVLKANPPFRSALFSELSD